MSDDQKSLLEKYGPAGAIIAALGMGGSGIAVNHKTSEDVEQSQVALNAQFQQRMADKERRLLDLEQQVRRLRGDLIEMRTRNSSYQSPRSEKDTIHP